MKAENLFFNIISKRLKNVIDNIIKMAKKWNTIYLCTKVDLSYLRII